MIIPRRRPWSAFAWRKAPYYIAAPIDRRLRATRAASRVRVPGPASREEHPTHGQEAFGTSQDVHPHALRTGPRRAVLAHPALRRPGSHRRAPEGMVRRYDAVPRRALRCVGRAAAGGVARAGRALLPARGGAERARGRERLGLPTGQRLRASLRGRPFLSEATRRRSAGSAAPGRVARRRPIPAPRTTPRRHPAPGRRRATP